MDEEEADGVGRASSYRPTEGIPLEFEAVETKEEVEEEEEEGGRLGSVVDVELEEDGAAVGVEEEG